MPGTTTENFVLCFAGENGSGVMLNLNQIKIIDQMRDGHCRIWFTESHTLEMNGPGADQFRALIMERSAEAAGAPINELLEERYTAATSG